MPEETVEAASITACPVPSASRPGRGMRLRSDDQLVALFRLGDLDAFTVIHDRYRSRLLAYTRQMLAGSPSDAEDALQDVFLRAYGTLRADDRPVSLRAWLYRVAHNRCVDHMRRPANQPSGELSPTLRCLDDDPSAVAERHEDLRRLVDDLGRLPATQRSALLMREMEGLTYAELADAMQATLPAVKSLLVRARIGLVEAREARGTACVEIRDELAVAHDRGVRAGARARRHLRECPGCGDYRAALKAVSGGLAALAPGAGPWGPLAKLLGLGGTAGGGAAGSVVLGGATAAKVTAIVCCAAVVGGGAVEAGRTLRSGPPTPPRAPAEVTAPAAAAVRRTPIKTATPPRPVAAPRAAPDAPRDPVALRTEATGAHAPRAELRAAPRTEEPSLGGTSGDEDAQAAAVAGGALAPEAAADLPPEGAQTPAPVPDESGLVDSVPGPPDPAPAAGEPPAAGRPGPGSVPADD